MSKYKLFAKNVVLLMLARFGSGALSFFLVPLYTSVLTTGEYGVYDLVGNTISILIPFFTQDIVDAVLRFSIDADGNKPAVLSVGLRQFFLSIIPLSILLVANIISGLFPEIRALEPYIFLSYVATALSGIVTFYARGLNRFADISISSVLSSAVTLGLNITFLVVFGWGLPGYFLANVIGPIIQIVFILLRINLHEVNPLRCDSNLEREMLRYSRPLIANSAAWWVNNASDRYIVTFFCGVGANGIYSVASKISNILFMFEAVFNQAWTISAVDEFDSEDKNGFFSGMYSTYNFAMVLIGSLVILADIPLAHLLYAGDFFSAWRYVPFLTIAVVFGASAGYVEGIFAAVKDTNTCARTTVIGAVVNVTMNLALVPLIGPLGSAIATTACYCVTWLLRICLLRRYMRIDIALWRDCLSYALLVLQGVLLLLVEPFSHSLMYLIQIGILVTLFMIYWQEITRIIHKFRSFVMKMVRLHG